MICVCYYISGALESSTNSGSGKAVDQTCNPLFTRHSADLLHHGGFLICQNVRKKVFFRYVISTKISCVGPYMSVLNENWSYLSFSKPKYPSYCKLLNSLGIKIWRFLKTDLLASFNFCGFSIKYPSKLVSIHVVATFKEKNLRVAPFKTWFPLP